MDAVLVQDADTFLDRGFLSATSRKLDDGFGAAGGNFPRARRRRHLRGSAAERVRTLRARYGRKQGRVLCITGVGTLLSVAALRMWSRESAMTACLMPAAAMPTATRH